MTRSHSDTEPPAFSRMELLSAVVIIGLVAGALGVLALLRPTQVLSERSINYQQSGAFGYSADAAEPSPYGDQGLTPGEPILTGVLGPVTMSFDYLFKSEAAGDVDGSISLLADVKLPEGLTRQFELSSKETFTGRRASASGVLPYRDIVRFIRRARPDSVASDFRPVTVTIRPLVEVHGSLDGHEFDSEFSPELVMELESDVLSVSTAAEPSPSFGEASSDQFHPRDNGRFHYDVPVTNTVPLLILEPTVPATRTIGFGLAGVCLIVGVWTARPLWRSGEGQNERSRIRTLYGAHLVEVSELSLRGGSVARVNSMDALVDLAKKYESKIMHVSGSGGDSYSVWDNGLLYEYRPAPEEDSAADSTSTGRHLGKDDLVDGRSSGVNGTSQGVYSAKI